MLFTEVNQKKLEETNLVAVEKNIKNVVENLSKNNHQVSICKDTLEINQGIKSLKTCIILPEITPVGLFAFCRPHTHTTEREL